jgi:hypothetical protein
MQATARARYLNFKANFMLRIIELDLPRVPETKIFAVELDATQRNILDSVRSSPCEYFSAARNDNVLRREFV